MISRLGDWMRSAKGTRDEALPGQTLGDWRLRVDRHREWLAALAPGQSRVRLGYR